MRFAVAHMHKSLHVCTTDACTHAQIYACVRNKRSAKFLMHLVHKNHACTLLSFSLYAAVNWYFFGLYYTYLHLLMHSVNHNYTYQYQ